MIIAVALLSYTSGDMRISTYTIKSKQAFYNAESGIEYARAKFEKNHEFNSDTPYYLDYNKTNTNGNDIYLSSDPKNNNDAGLTVKKEDKGLQITSIGNYMGIDKTVIRYVKLNSNAGGFNLKRKFNVGNLVCDSGNDIDFKVKNGNGNMLDNDERFLLINNPTEKDIVGNSDIILSKENGKNGNSIKYGDNFILALGSSNTLPDIDSVCERDKWINYDGNVQYYVASKGDKELDSIYSGTGFNTDMVKVILVDGDLTISQEAVNDIDNTVIYCKGTIILDNCTVDAPGNGNNKKNDYDICLISDSVKINGDVVFSYYDGNSNTILDYENSILNILSDNIKSDISW
jgi:hypothetical protein